MTPQQIAIAKALGRASLPIGTASKSFATNMAYLAEHDSTRVISAKQDVFLRQLAHRFRRQMPVALYGEEDKTKPKMLLQWLGPEMAGSGLLTNEGWVTTHTAEAEAIYSNQAMKIVAVMLAALDRRA